MADREKRLIAAMLEGDDAALSAYMNEAEFHATIVAIARAWPLMLTALVNQANERAAFMEQAIEAARIAPRLTTFDGLGTPPSARNADKPAGAGGVG